MARANSGGAWFVLIFVILALTYLSPLFYAVFTGRI